MNNDYLIYDYITVKENNRIIYLVYAEQIDYSMKRLHIYHGLDIINNVSIDETTLFINDNQTLTFSTKEEKSINLLGLIDEHIYDKIDKLCMAYNIDKEPILKTVNKILYDKD